MGALTSKPYAFVSRPWELKSIESIDVFDSYLSSIRYDYRGVQILRVLPSINSGLNSEWITDKIRFHYDAIYHQRISNPWIKSSLVSFYLTQFELNKFSKTDLLLPLSWTFIFELLNFFVNRIKLDNNLKFFHFFGISEGLNSLQNLLKLQNFFGSNNRFEDNAFVGNRDFFGFDLKTLSKSELCVLVNCNPRLELPLLNLKLRELSNANILEILVFGSNLGFNFNCKSLGFSISTFFEFLTGRSQISVYLLRFNNPFFIFGALNQSSTNFKFNFDKIIKTYLFKRFPHKISNLLLTSSTEINLLELGTNNFTNSLSFNPIHSSLFYLNNYDSIEFDKKYLSNKQNFLQRGLLNNLIVYSGSHGDFSAEFSDFIFPISMSSEYSDLYLNLELKLKVSRIVLPPNFSLIRSSESLSRMLAYTVKDNFLFNFQKISNFNYSNYSLTHHNVSLNTVYYKKLFLNDFKIYNNNYLVNSVSRSSQFLTLAYNNYKQKFKNFIFNNV
jgi:NADH-quinone oxidoreductase subunit G